jgi:hypothetical protein
MVSAISKPAKSLDRIIHSRNAFAPGGVYKDPATGAAAAARFYLVNNHPLKREPISKRPILANLFVALTFQSSKYSMYSCG